MADEASASAPAEGLANLHLDEVTGERVSKSELKKRQRQRMKDEEKAKKAAAAPPKPVVEKKSNAEADEKELNPNVSFKENAAQKAKLTMTQAIF
jgi:lysyl-tRNA synthetase class 2